MSPPPGLRPLSLLEPEEWDQRYGTLLFSTALHRLGDRELARDLVQETFLSAWKARMKFRGDCSEKNFLFGILKNKIIDSYRAQQRKPVILASQLEEPGDLEQDSWLDRQAEGTQEQNPSFEAQRNDFRRHLDGALTKLPEKMRQAFQLSLVDGLPPEEVTERLGITVGNLWVIIHRAKKLIRNELESEWEPESLAA